MTATQVDGMTPLHLAAFAGHVDVAGSLVAHGADATTRDNSVRTPWEHAVLKGHVEVMRVLDAGSRRVVRRLVFPFLFVRVRFSRLTSCSGNIAVLCAAALC